MQPMTNQKRRSKGHGHIKKQANGRWFGRLRKDGNEITITADTKKEAQEKLDQAAKQLGIKRWDRALNEIIGTWLDQGKTKWAENTANAYTDRASRLIAPYLGRHKLSEINPTAIENALGAAERDGYTTGNLRAFYDTLAIILNYARKQGWIAENPVSSVERPAHTKREPDPLTPAEAERILQHCDETNNPYFLFHALTITMGLRQGEARAARKEHIQGDYLKIPRGNTKTDAGERMIPITAWVRKAMDKPAAQHHSPYLVASTRGHKLSTPTITRAWKRLLAELGIGDRRIHDCRHTCGSVLAANGVPTRVIQAILGHASETMANHYSQQTKENLKDAMADLL